MDSPPTATVPKNQTWSAYEHNRPLSRRARRRTTVQARRPTSMRRVFITPDPQCPSPPPHPGTEMKEAHPKGQEGESPTLKEAKRVGGTCTLHSTTPNDPRCMPSAPVTAKRSACQEVSRHDHAWHNVPTIPRERELISQPHESQTRVPVMHGQKPRPHDLGGVASA